MSRLIPVVFFGVLLCLIACEKSIDREIVPFPDQRLVVESVLTNIPEIQEVVLSLTFDDLNQAPSTVENALVSVSAGGTTYTFHHDSDRPGHYLSDPAFAAVPQLQYQLSIELGGNHYTAQSSLSEVAPLQTITFEHHDSLGNFIIPDDVVPLYSDVQQAMYRIDLDWSHLQPLGQNIARAYYYTFNTIHISEFVQPPHRDIIFPRGTIATITKYGLSPDYADFLRSKVIETDWNGSFFFGNPENTPTNLSGGAIGYFAVCAVVRETMVVE